MNNKNLNLAILWVVAMLFIPLSATAALSIKTKEQTPHCPDKEIEFTVDGAEKDAKLFWTILCGEIPEEYRQEGLFVNISGKVTNCKVQRGCIEPYRVLIPMYIFELSSITEVK